MNLENNIYLAPFQGITGSFYRNAFSKHFGGVSKMFTPFFLNLKRFKKIPEKQIRELGAPTINGVKVVPQILSKVSDEIIFFAEFCKQSGFDEINWNLGCPYPQVANKKRGSGMLKYPEMIFQILDEVYTKMPIQLSIKCRIGYESENEVISYIDKFNNYPLSELIVHPRLGKQLYEGVPNIEIYKAIEQRVSNFPIVYNGDIFNENDFVEKRKSFINTNCYMIGRGLLENPFLAMQINNMIILENKKNIVKKFVDDLFFEYSRTISNKPVIVGIMKELWKYLSNSFENPKEVFNRIKLTKTIDEYEFAVRKVFENNNLI